MNYNKELIQIGPTGSICKYHMKSSTRVLLAGAIILGVLTVLVPFAANAADLKTASRKAPVAKINLTSPNGGEKWQIGTTEKIKWSTSNVPSNASISIGATGFGSFTVIGEDGLPHIVNQMDFNLTENEVANSGSVSIPVTLNPGIYKIFVKTIVNGTIIYDISKNYFTVVAPKSWPHIFLLSVNSGKPGTKVTIYGNNLYSPSAPFVATFNNATHDNAVSGVASRNGHSFVFTIPTDPVSSGIGAGNYTITLENTLGQHSNSVPFTVIAPAQPVVPVVSQNAGFANQNISPNSSNVKIGSYVIQNQSTSESIRLTSLNVQMIPEVGIFITNFSSLRTSDTTGSGSTPIQPTGNDNFSVNDTLAPGASITIDIFANTGASTTGTIQTALQVTSISTADNITSTSSTITGQTMSIVQITLNTPTRVASLTTPSQYIASPDGAQNATQVTYNFTATNGAATITELRFNVTGNDTVTAICAGLMCAQPINGVAYLTGLNITVPAGMSGINQRMLVSYSPVGAGGIDSGLTSNIALTYVKYVAGGTTSTITPNVTAPTMVLVGSKPTVSVASTNVGGLVIGAENKIGEVTITATQGAIKINTITFNLGANGFSIAPMLTSMRITDGLETIADSSCSQKFGSVLTCILGNGYSTDYPIPAGQSITFNLFATVDAVVAPGMTASLSTSVTPDHFIWDDTSANGLSGTGLNGLLIYGFPTASYSVHQ